MTLPAAKLRWLMSKVHDGAQPRPPPARTTPEIWWRSVVRRAVPDRPLMVVRGRAVQRESDGLTTSNVNACLSRGIAESD